MVNGFSQVLILLFRKHEVSLGLQWASCLYKRIFFAKVFAQIPRKTQNNAWYPRSLFFKNPWENFSTHFSTVFRKINSPVLQRVKQALNPKGLSWLVCLSLQNALK